MDKPQAGQFLSFSLGDLSYAIPIGVVREINRVLTITPVPETPKYLCGVMNLRGRVTPIIDMKIRFGLPGTAPSKQSCVMVVDSEKGQAGLLVDSIHGVVNLEDQQIEPRPHISSESSGTFVVGMAKLEKKVLILVDVERILTSSAFESFAKAA